jgi:hypothetical protein
MASSSSAIPQPAPSLLRSHDALYNIAKAKATSYMNSNPGVDNLGSNTNCHPGFHRLVEGAHLDIDEVYRPNEILDYRLGLIEQAESYCHVLGIGMPKGLEADQFDYYKWVDIQYKAQRGTSAECLKVALDLKKKFDTITSWLFYSDIFESPLSGQGLYFTKPDKYLAFRLAESPIPTEQILEMLEELCQSIYLLSNSYFYIF